MARIVQQGVITTSGTSYENEPIIKSDGAGEVMQWQPSDGAADGIFISENSAGDPLRLGVGTSSPEAALDVNSLVSGGDGIVYGAIIRGTESAPSEDLLVGDGIGLKFEIPNNSGSSNIGASIEAVRAEGVDSNSSTNLVFRTSQNDETLDTALTISATGDITQSSGEAGGVIDYLLKNTDNTNAASGVRQILHVGGVSAGDPRVVLAVPGVTEWSMGLDNSDSDSFKIGNDSTVGSNTRLSITTAGNVGIGTPSPDSLVEVSGADECQLKVTGASGVEAVLRASATTATVGTNTAHKLYLRTNNSARLTIDGTSGLATFSAGIAFQSATTGSGTGTGYTLDSYEVGEWTPTITTGITNSGTGTTLIGEYVRIGKTVHVRAKLDAQSGNTFTIGSFGQIGGLPFTVNSTYIGPGTLSTNNVTSTGTCLAGNSSTSLYTAGLLTGSNQQQLQFGATYEV
mgnify:CR=1 FL=1